METFWQEVNFIVEEEEEEGGDQAEDEIVDEVELEEAWLTEAGLSSLLTNESPAAEEAESPSVDALLSTLTRRQAATVKTRLDQYKETLRRRGRSHRQPIRDVRDIFIEPDDDSANSGSAPPTSKPASPLNHNKTTNTLRRQTARPSLPVGRLSPSEEVVREADWMLRDCPYSEGVADHKVGGTCWDCVRFRGDRQAVTRLDDVSSCDLTRLSFLSHIELSTLLAALGVQSKRRRPRRHRSAGGAVFGVPLTSLLATDRKTSPETNVPVVFHKLVCILEQTGLQTEGILRVSGSAARIKYLRTELDSSRAFDWSTVRTVEAAALLKLFIRELPTPLLTHTHTAVLGVSSDLHQLQALHLLTLLLPEAHRHTLRALLQLLGQVVSHQDINLMSVNNVSMVMAPNLFSSHRHGNRAGLEEAVGGANLVRLMVLHADWLFTVPVFLLTQLRRMNQAANQKQLRLQRVKTLLTRTKDRQVSEVCDEVIRVRAPGHSKVSMAIQLDKTTTARDVTARFEDSSIQRLYEVGGNICERRLHPDCLLLAVYRVNPCCDWLLKP